MPELKFSAVDTALAMEEVQKVLGPDALILSTERRNGMIEIVATNDPEKVETANILAMDKLKARRDGRPSPKTDAPTESQRFSEIIDAETSKFEDTTETANSEEIVMPLDASIAEDLTEPLRLHPVLSAIPEPFSKTDIAPAVSRITEELKFLLDGTMALATAENNSTPIDAQMKMLGFSNDTIDRLVKDPEFESKISYLIKKFTKTIVQGKSKDFDESQVILVCGPERSGKTVLSKKLEKFLPASLDGSPTTVIADPLVGDLASIFKSGLDSNITSLFRKRPGANINSGRLIIDYEGSMEVLSSVLLKLDELEPRPNVSVVYALEVGKSYRAVKNLLEKVHIPNLYIALTKMDLLEVSVNELSAISDFNKKILFFSGLKVAGDGLDFAKVSVMENFLTNLAKQEGR
jgi:hypothetical protein